MLPPCSADACDRAGFARGWCRMHYDRWYRQRGPASLDGSKGRPRQQLVGYSGVHFRLRRDRGSAKTRDCIGCGDIAFTWAYMHTDPDELIDSYTGHPYSLKPDHYYPMCKSCHSKFDHQRSK